MLTQDVVLVRRAAGHPDSGHVDDHFLLPEGGIKEAGLPGVTECACGRSVRTVGKGIQQYMPKFIGLL